MSKRSLLSKFTCASLIVVLGVCGLVPIAPISRPGAQTAPSSNLYNIGMNLPQLVYWNNTAVYADVMNGVSGNNGAWDIPPSGVAPLDSTGAPTVAARTFFPAVYPSGAYSASWTGTGTISCTGGCSMGPITVNNGVSTAILTITQRPPANPSDKPFNTLNATPPVSNIHIMAPPSLRAPGGSLFMADTISKLQPFGTVRLMDTLNTNFGFANTTQNPVTNWSDRTWPNEGSRGGRPQGIAYEDIINFANTTGKDVWINIPILATDDYVCRLARLLAYGEPGDKSNTACSTTAPPSGTETAINSKSHIYLEESNEGWNFIFASTLDLACWGNSGPVLGSCQTPTPTSSILKAAIAAPSWSNLPDTRSKAAAAGMVLTKRNHDIFTQVFGAASASQIRAVYSIQSCCPPTAALTWMANTYGPMSSYFYALAAAPYFQLANNADDTTTDAIFNDLNGQVLVQSSMGAMMLRDLQAAQKFGVQLVAYEGGQSLVQNTAAELAAQFDARMYSADLAYFSLWNANVGKASLFTYYSFISSYTNFGYWGSMVSSVDHGSQKYDSLLSLTVNPGDINLDGVVNQSDCVILRASFGKTAGMWWRDGDLNHDGAVNAADLAILNQNITGAQCALLNTNSHDFNGDGKSDILWRDGNGNLAMWLMSGAQVAQSAGLGVVPPAWSVVAQRDFNGDGKSDLLWRDTSGNVAMWLMNGMQIAQSAGVGNAPSIWSIVGTGDFNGDGQGDILWQDTSGNVAMWLMNGPQVVQSAGVGNAPSVWSIVGTADFNGDGKSDILWRDNNGNLAMWLMNGTQITQSGGVGTVSAAWSIAGTGDFDGDGRSDILWRDSNGNLAMWLMNGTQITQSAGIGAVPANWSIAETGDFDGDGKSDILWYDTSGGNVAIWFMNGTQVKQSSGVGNVPPTVWKVQGVNAD